jgi:hypothetical protein
MELELSLIAIILAVGVLLLQIVSLLQIAEIRKSLRMQRDERSPQHMQQGNRFDKRNQDFRRHERRPYQDQRPQPSPAPQASVAIDPVEKSLRDINMRLKSAERDQESARRRIQENFPRGDQHRNRDERDHRGNRGRDHNRNPRRDNWQERNRSGGFQQPHQAPAATQEPRNAPVVEKRESAVPPTEVAATVQQPYQENGPQGTTAADVDSGGENLQHGRKIVVNRRMLDGEPRNGASVGAVDAPVSEAGPLPAEGREEETRIGDTDINPGGEIRFGRR